MDFEVSALMGAAGEELWEKEGLFSLVDELCKVIAGCCNLKSNLNDFTLDTTTSPVVGKKCLSQNCRATLPTKRTSSFVLGSKDGSGFIQTNGGLGTHLDAEDAKLPGISNPLNNQPMETLGRRSSSQRGFVKRNVSVWKPKKSKRKMVMGWTWS